MKKITRRKAIAVVGVTSSAAMFLPSCCFIRGLLKVPCEPLRIWKNKGFAWWKVRKKRRKLERKVDIVSGKRVDIDLPIPLLDCRKESSTHGSVMSQFRQFHLNEWNEFYCVATNSGNAPTWNCIIETYETNTIPYDMAFTEFILNDRKYISLMPGESQEVKLKFRVTKEENGGWGIRIGDPICDPWALTFQQYDRHNSGFGWAKWII